MKLYTEKQLRKLLSEKVNIPPYKVDDLMNEMESIIIPTDEEIKLFYSKLNNTALDIATIYGALIIVDRIRKGHFVKNIN